MITAMPRVAIAVRDFTAAVETFRGGLGMPVVDLSETSVGSLGAKLAMCVPEGGSNIELMAPADPEAPLDRSLRRFLERRGEGLFALMLEAADPDREAVELERRGLDVLPPMAGAGGRDVHPGSTHGVLIRVYPRGSFRGRAGPETEARDGPGLSGIARVILAVRELEPACEVYGRGLGLAVDAPREDPERGVRAAVCRPPSGGVIELVAAGDESRPFAASISAFLRAGREGMYALILQAAAPAEARARLAARGIAVRGGSGAFEIDPAATFGARLLVEGSEARV